MGSRPAGWANVERNRRGYGGTKERGEYTPPRSGIAWAQRRGCFDDDVAASSGEIKGSEGSSMTEKGQGRSPTPKKRADVLKIHRQKTKTTHTEAGVEQPDGMDNTNTAEKEELGERPGRRRIESVSYEYDARVRAR